MNTRNTLLIENGKLVIGEIVASDLARKFGTPLYVMDAGYICEVCDAFVGAMKEYGNGAVAYASKAFATTATTKLMAKHGMWFDAVSGGEVFLLQNAGVDMKHVLFHGNNKTPKEIAEGIAAGVGYFVIDSFSELENLDKIAAASGVVQEVLIRVNPGVTAHTHEAIQTATPLSKFGFGVDDQAVDVVKTIISKQNLVFKGLHLHIGSQIYDHSSYDLAIEIVTDLIKNLKIEDIFVEVLDLGGGYGSYYTDEDPKFTPKRYGYTLKNICNKLQKCCAEKAIAKPFLVVEPGRSIVGEAGITLYTIGAIKDFPNVKKYVVVDGGMFENPRHALYGVQYSAILCDKADKEMTDVVTIAGKCCESGDIISKDIQLQKAEVGDFLAVFSTGAYNYSLASNYNLNCIPPVVLVNKDNADFIVAPEAYSDLLRRNTVPRWLND